MEKEGNSEKRKRRKKTRDETSPGANLGNAKARQQNAQPKNPKSTP